MEEVVERVQPRSMEQIDNVPTCRGRRRRADRRDRGMVVDQLLFVEKEEASLGRSGAFAACRAQSQESTELIHTWYLVCRQLMEHRLRILRWLPSS